MPQWESAFLGKPIQKLRDTLTTLRRAGAIRLTRFRRFVRWFVRGVIVGAVWAMLFTPQSGAATRQAIGQLLHPLVEIGITLRTWWRRQERSHHDALAARRAGGEDCTAPEEWRATARGGISDAGEMRESVEHSLPRSGEQES
jgi:hypothetical protein